MIIYEIATATVVQFLSTTEIAIAEVVQADSNLNQTLVKASRCALLIGPKILPNLMRLKEIAGVEVVDPLQIARVVGGVVRHGTAL